MTSSLPLGAVERVVGGHAALRAAADTGIVARLARAPGDARAVAADLHLDVDLVARVLDVLAAEGVVDALGDGSYLAAEQVGTLVDRLEGFYSNLGRALTGDADIWSVETTGGSGAFYPEVVSALATAFADAAARAAAELASPGLRVLDAGAGGAPWSLAVVAREPTCQILAVDVPEVLPTTRRRVAAAGWEERYGFLAADIFELDPGATFDLVLAGNLCHLFSPQRAADLVRRLAAALAPAGTLAVLDIPADAGSEPGIAEYQLGLALRTCEGGLHASSDYQRWLREAGLVEPQRRDIGVSSVALFTGRRAGAPYRPNAGSMTSRHDL